LYLVQLRIVLRPLSILQYFQSANYLCRGTSVYRLLSAKPLLRVILAVAFSLQLLCSY